MYPFNLFIGSFSVNNYELFNFLGLVFLVIFAVTLLDKDAPVKRWQVFVACVIGILAGTTGAKLTHLLLYAEKYRGIPPVQALFVSGHAFMGGAVFALLAVYIVSRCYKVSFLYAGDYALPYFGLCRVFGRLGCLLTGCCHGSASSLPWATYFRDGILRHPTQAYMIILAFSIFVAGRAHYRKLKDRPGIIFFSSVMFYGLGRFFVEFFRVDSPYVLGSLKFSHIILIVISICGVLGFCHAYKKYIKTRELSALVNRYIGTFLLSLIATSIIILTILFFVPKVSYIDEIDLKISRDGIRVIVPISKSGETYSEKRKEYLRKIDVHHALARYKDDSGVYPTQEQGLKALMKKPKILPIPRNWNGPYLKGELKNKQGKRYRYKVDEKEGRQHYSIY